MKKIVRFTEAALIHRERKAPLALIKYEGIGFGDCFRTNRVEQVSYDEEGALTRIETENFIYVQVKP
ncbi:hypothetical protein [Stenotrophomonas phage BUCT627]|uniref:Uncharacterized protein n=1 Tax=Stenotrophomonas phage BUCT627 TaxID=2860377 RepID=A0AC61NL77_9CAUD|nr:hypothetical protein PQD77_gp003 [Stenotrophomonas phage BUCT627]QYC96609.1 hypothetical protein [Stenotrophomonas phage BUCT627]